MRDENLKDQRQAKKRLILDQIEGSPEEVIFSWGVFLGRFGFGIALLREPLDEETPAISAQGRGFVVELGARVRKIRKRVAEADEGDSKWS